MIIIFQLLILCQMDDTNTGRRLRLLELINSLNIKHKAFAESLGKRPTALSHLINGQRNITAGFAYEISKRYTWFNPDWLISGDGDMRRDETQGIKYGPGDSGVRTLEDLEAEYRADPLAGLRSLIERVEALERWRAEVEGKLDL